jgi:peptidoglycan/LPS O-acetylase OafA/YrhL
MICEVYRHARIVKGKRTVDNFWTGHLKLRGDLVVAHIPLGVSDKEVARQRLAEIRREREQRAVGLLTPKSALICLVLLFLFSCVRFFSPEIQAGFWVAPYLVAQGIILGGFVWYLWKISTRRHGSENPKLAPAPPMAGPTAKHRSDPLLTLRFFACFMVLGGHAILINFRPAHLLRDMARGEWYYYLVPEPWVGVWVFFVLSGYLMGKGFYTRRYNESLVSVLCFFRNRFLRIAPLYAAATLLVAVLAKPAYFFLTHPWKLGAALFLFDPTTDPMPISALWSVGAEMEFYLAVPFVFVLFHRAFARRGILCFSLMAGAGFIFRWWELQFAFHKLILFAGPVLQFIDLVLSGFVLNGLVHRFRPRVAIKNGVTVSFFLMLGYYLVAAWYCRSGRMLEQPGDYLDLMLVFPTASIFLVSAIIFLMENASVQGENPITRWLVDRTQMLGLLTFSLYVWHEPIFSFMGRLSKKMFSSMSLADSLGMFATGSIAVFLVSLISYYFIELYFDRKKALPLPA